MANPRFCDETLQEWDEIGKYFIDNKYGLIGHT